MSKHAETHIEIFSDGACSGNPGPGGWGTLLRSGRHEKELSGYAEKYEEALQSEGAILFRGFAVSDAKDFRNFGSQLIQVWMDLCTNHL